MQDKSSTFGLSREKLSRLWKIGELARYDQNDLDEEQKKSKPLQDKKLKSFTACSFKDLLLDPDTDPSILKAIKEIHKEQAESSSSEPEREMAVILYYASIANALVYHNNVKFTKLSYTDLRDSFAKLRSSGRMSSDLKQLFEKAHELCVRHINEPEK